MQALLSVKIFHLKEKFEENLIITSQPNDKGLGKEIGGLIRIS